MPPNRADVPTEADVLCEQCGYRLNGLPDDGRCPECGTPVAESTSHSGRHRPEWETAERRTAGLFLRTVGRVIGGRKRFFRGLSLEGDDRRAGLFGTIALAASALLFALGLSLHFHLMTGNAFIGRFASKAESPFLWTALWAIVTVAFAGLVFVTGRLTGLLVVALTSLEARFWGFRLDRARVRRGLHYLPASYVPAAGAFLLYVSVARVLIEQDAKFPVSISTPSNGINTYLYGISAVVIISAIYIFTSYTAAMRKLMYANRVEVPRPRPDASVGST